MTVDLRTIVASDGTTLHVDKMREGYLVRGTLDVEMALEAVLADQGVQLEAGGFRAQPGVYRKVPGQWSSWRLHAAKPGPGAFQAVAIYTHGPARGNE